jgi:nucleoprotein TPR
MFSNIFTFACIPLKVRADNLMKEKEMLKLSEVRLSQQRESLLGEQR